MEIGICRWGQGLMVLEDRHIDYTDGAVTVIPANCLHTTLSLSLIHIFQTGRCPEAAGVGGEHHRGQRHRLDAHDAEHRQDDRQTAAPHTGKGNRQGLSPNFQPCLL